MTTFDKVEIGAKFVVPSFPPKGDETPLVWTKDSNVLATDEWGRQSCFVTCLTVPVEIVK